MPTKHTLAYFSKGLFDREFPECLFSISGDLIMQILFGSRLQYIDYHTLDIIGDCFHHWLVERIDYQP